MFVWCVRVRACECMYAYIMTSIYCIAYAWHTYIPISIHAYIRTYMHINTWLCMSSIHLRHTYGFVFVWVYEHMYICMYVAFMRLCVYGGGLFSVTAFVWFLPRWPGEPHAFPPSRPWKMYVCMAHLTGLLSLGFLHERKDVRVLYACMYACVYVCMHVHACMYLRCV
jgi:hypothetical protein